MKKIIPFKKDIIFKNNLSEITSISLEHSLHISDDNLITGEFIVSGDYRMTDSSINTDSFKYNLPFDINMDEHYILDKVEIDIDDFYYEIKDNNILSVCIEVLIDKIEEKNIYEEIKINKEDVMKEILIEDDSLELVRNDQENVMKLSGLDVDDVVASENDINSEIKTLFDNIDDSNETYSTYYVYIVRENDTLETILQKYSINKEILEIYNDLKEIKMGDKLIIPSLNA